MSFEASTTLATPAFLSSLRPPPLPAWAQSPTTTALSATRLSLLLASSVTTTSFSIARSSTQFAFSIARTFLAPVASTVGGILDHSLGLDVGGGTGIGKGPIVASIHGALNTAETLALFGIEVGSEITKVGLGGMKSTVEYLEGYFGNDEALRALGAFLKLVEREWGESLPSDPEGEGGLGRWSMIQVAKAASTWAVLQNTTSGLDEARWAPELEELDLHTWGRPLSHRRAGKINAEDGVVFQVTEEQILEGGEEVIQASLTGGMLSEGETEDERTRFRLRRFSKICLGSYGGMGMIFFGVKLPSPFSQTPSITSPNTPLTNAARSTQSRSLDESSLAQAFGASSSKNSEASTEKEVQLEADDLEAEMAQLDSEWVAVDPELEMEGGKGPGLWGLLSGSHDTKVIEALGDFDAGSTFVDAAGVDEIAVPSPHTKAGRRPPRFFVVTDHRRHQVLLCLRGTMSIDDLATDLACELLPFPSEDFWDEAGDGGEVFKTYQVHGGMWEVALAMGHPRGAVTRAISKALIANPEYELYLMGHSLGAGVAALLGIMWTNPNSGLTSSKSGLPAGKHVQVYGFAPPCTTDAKLSVLCKNFIHSFVYSSDAVSRFSLGHIRDIRSAAAWLCYANSNPEESCNNILSRLLAYRNGRLDSTPVEKRAEEEWFMALRTTLEANMNYAEVFPPGDVLWLVKAGDAMYPNDAGSAMSDQARLFRVTGEVGNVYKQMLFTSKMLSSHLPHKYMQVIEESL